MGLIQISTALKFVHTAEIIHGDVSPENIVLDRNFEWRLAGFHHHCKTTALEQTEECATFPETAITNKYALASLPNLNFLAPEYVMDRSRATASDIYAVAGLIIAWYVLHSLAIALTAAAAW